MNKKEREIYEIEKQNFNILSKTRGRVFNTEKQQQNKVDLKKICHIPQRLFIRSISKEPNKHNLSKEDWLQDLSLDNDKCKIAVYTSIFGGYDILQEPEFFADNIDYFVFSDNNPQSLNWKYLPTPQKLIGFENLLINRYLKMHPAEFFGNYDYVIYVDGNVKLVSDVSGSVRRVNQEYGIALHNHARRNCLYKEAKVLRLSKKGSSKKIQQQVKSYKREGFPGNYGLLEATIIISNPKSIVANKLFQEWWNEFMRSESMRDQLSLPYILWKSKIPVSMIGTLGTNLYRNPKYQIINHN